MSLKLEFIEKAKRRGTRMSALCREYGISRETGYKWLRRYQREGLDGLEERSRRPHSSPLATAEDVVVAVLKERERYPRRGPKKLRVQLERRLGKATPSVATIARVLRRMGLARQRSKYRRRSIVEQAPSVMATACNEVWTADFKGWWRAGDGQRCEPLTVRDAYSRYVLIAKAFASPSLDQTRRVFKELFKRYGVPRQILVDNGTPFINVQARGGLTRLSAWWTSLGISVLRSRPGCPQDNGGHERMHRDLKEEVQAFPSGSRAAEQRALDRWRQDFNHVRPHEALGNKTPGSVKIFVLFVGAGSDFLVECAVAESDDQLGIGGTPVRWWNAVPLSFELTKGQENGFDGGIVAGEVPLCHYDLANSSVERFDCVGCVNNPPQHRG